MLALAWRAESLPDSITFAYLGSSESVSIHLSQDQTGTEERATAVLEFCTTAIRALNLSDLVPSPEFCPRAIYDVKKAKRGNKEQHSHSLIEIYIPRNHCKP
mmetsp:Transcript_24365/g.43225  ORF Transcript_24365/g.43225 Transcript_24365/m.43225 type:complete len:102 (+) Transcript_24365:170-475(+)